MQWYTLQPRISPSWENFITQKIVDAAASIAKGKSDSLELGNLDIERDWGYAPLCPGYVVNAQKENSS